MRLCCSHMLLRIRQSVTCENLSDFCLTRLDRSTDESDAATPLCFLSIPRPTSQSGKSQSQQSKCISRTSSARSTGSGQTRGVYCCSPTTPRGRRHREPHVLRAIGPEPEVAIEPAVAPPAAVMATTPTGPSTISSTRC